MRRSSWSKAFSVGRSKYGTSTRPRLGRYRRTSGGRAPNGPNTSRSVSSLSIATTEKKERESPAGIIKSSLHRTNSPTVRSVIPSSTAKRQSYQGTTLPSTAPAHRSKVYRDAAKRPSGRTSSGQFLENLHPRVWRTADDAPVSRRRMPAWGRHLLHEHLHGAQDWLVGRRLADRRHPGLWPVHGHRPVAVRPGVQHHTDVRVRRRHDGVGRRAACRGPGHAIARLRNPAAGTVRVEPFGGLSGSVLRRAPPKANDRGRQPALSHRHGDRRDHPGNVRKGPRGRR